MQRYIALLATLVTLLPVSSLAADVNYTVLNGQTKVLKDMGDSTVADRVVVVGSTGVVAPAGTVADPQHNITDAAGGSGGMATTCRLITSAATTNATTCSASAKRLYMASCYNTKASVLYLKLYDKGASVPDPATDTPFRTVVLAPSATTTVSFGSVGRSLTNGLGFVMTTTVADNSTSAVASNDVLGCNFDLN